MISGNVADTVRETKQQPGENILRYDFGDVTKLLVENGLLDELRIWTHPVLSGKPDPIYLGGVRTDFEFNDTEVHDTGLVILSYVRSST